MKKFTDLLWMTAAMAFTSCTVYQEVLITKDKSVDFSQYKTFAWLPEVENDSNSDYNNDFIRQKTRNYFEHCMIQRQLKTDTLNPQLLLRVEWLSHAREVEVPRVFDLPDSFTIEDYNPPTVYLSKDRVGGKPVWEEKSDTEIVKYAHGGAKLTAFDRSTNQQVWEGIAQGDLYDPSVMYDDLHPAIHQLMKKFPIKIPKNNEK